VTEGTTVLQTLNPEWGVSIARNVHPAHGEWPLVMLHSPGLAYAFDSHNTGLDSPAASMAMLVEFGLHELRDPHSPTQEASGWHLHLDRDEDGDDPRPSQLRGPYPLAPISPVSRRPIEPSWRDLARGHDWWAQLLVVSGVDFSTLFDYEYAGALIAAADDHRVAGGLVRVHP
jgi:hypothetical protein